MWKQATLLFSLVTIALGVGAAYLSQQLSAAQELAANEAANRQKLESQMKAMQTKYEELEAAYFNLQRRESLASVAGKGMPHEYKEGVSPTLEKYPSGFFNVPPNAEWRGGGMRGGPRMGASMEIIRHLKLNETEAKKLLQVLTDNQDKFRRALATSDGSPADQQTLDALRAEEDQQIHDALGDAKYQEYEDYRKYMPEHQQIERLNTRLANANEGTLSQEQQDQLFAALKEERNRIPAPQSTDFASRPDFMSAYEQWRDDYSTRTQTRASTILTPDQLNTFKNLRGPGFRGPQPANGQPIVRPGS